MSESPSNASVGKESEKLRAPDWWPAFALAIVFGAGLVVAGWLGYGKPVAEKVATALAMPVGSIWLLTSGRAAQLLLRGRLYQGKMVLTLWLVLFAGGTGHINGIFFRWLENREKSIDLSPDSPLDLVVVLGGGTTQAPLRAQAGCAGDRIVLAAELFHQRIARQLLTTGQVIEGFSRDSTSPAEQTIEIWTKLGVPRESIKSLGGRNTYEEIANLKSIWPELKGQRVGLLTSALHLPRAMRLARGQGLELLPIAANIRSGPPTWNLIDFIPNANNFQGLATSQHEIMAYFISR